jgi:hypothetical protein
MSVMHDYGALVLEKNKNRKRSNKLQRQVCPRMSRAVMLT